MQPRQELEQYNQHFSFRNTDKEETGIRIFTVNSDKSPVQVNIPEINEKHDVTSWMAYVGAKTSRSNEPYSEVYEEIRRLEAENPGKASQRLETIIGKFGHASVGDMAIVPLQINRIPIHLAAEIWNMVNVGAGQESSTRYIEFDGLKSSEIDNVLDLSKISKEKAEDIRERWETVNHRMQELYSNWNANLREAFRKIFPDADESSVNKRSYDIARNWLPMGTLTSMTLFMSVRNWGTLIKRLSESNDPENIQLAAQLKYSLTLPEHGADIKLKVGRFLTHTEATNVVENNVKNLRKFLLKETDILEYVDTIPITVKTVVESKAKLLKITNPHLFVAMQYLMRIFPDLTEAKALSWLKRQKPNIQRKISEIMYKNHNHHEALGNIGDLRGSDMFALDLPMSAVRDLARHRAVSRNQDLYSINNPYRLLSKGFVRNHALFNTKGRKFEMLQKRWEVDAKHLYQEIKDLIYAVVDAYPKADARWLLRILPLGHMCHLQLTASPDQVLYMISLREQRGGDFEYVAIVQKMLEEIKKEREFSSGMLSKRINLNVNSAKEFVKRS